MTTAIRHPDRLISPEIEPPEEHIGEGEEEGSHGGQAAHPRQVSQTAQKLAVSSAARASQVKGLISQASRP